MPYLTDITESFIKKYRMQKGKNKSSKPQGKLLFLVPFIAAGGLGLIQKIQQRSPCADQKASFLCIAFMLSAIISLTAFFTFGKPEKPVAPIQGYIVPSVGVGIAYGGSNLLSTYLVGRLAGTVVFPIMNISVILLTLLCGLLFYKEKIRTKEVLVLFFGITSILLLSIV